MKVLIKKLIIFFMFIPFIVNAKELCTVVSGTGKDIGNEIACGSEHFYIIENNNETVKMLSKYNLYVGNNFDKITLDINQTYVKYLCDNDYCGQSKEFYFEGEAVDSYGSWANKIKEKYDLNGFSWLYYSESNKYDYALVSEIYSDKFVENDKEYRYMTYKLYPYAAITNETIGYALQNEKARGVTGEKGNANYPIYATLTLFDDDSIHSYVKNVDNFETGYTNFDFINETYTDGGEKLYPIIYLNEYSNNLSKMGFDITSVDMLNIKEIDDLVYSISNKRLPLKDWYNASINKEQEGEELSKYTYVGDLKEYLSNDYSWLWNTTYWTKTFASNSANEAEGHKQVYFVSSAGEICYSESECNVGVPRAGIRPVVNISSDSILYPYDIETETDGNGKIEVVNKAYKDDKITFKVISNPNYKITSLTIFDNAGNSITFNEDQITENDDGTISINTFTMPSNDVKIIAKFETKLAAAVEEVLVNPKTGVFSPLYIFLFTLFVGGISYFAVLNKYKSDIRMD